MTQQRGVFRWLFALGLAILVVIVLVTVGLDLALASIQSNQAQLQRQQRQQHAQLVAGCERSNITRAEDNASHYADYEVDSFVVARFLKATPTETAAQKQITNAFSKTLRGAVDAKEWTPLTNCAEAIGQAGARYQAALPIPFTNRRPPASALSTSNAALLTPAGSAAARPLPPPNRSGRS